MGNFINILKNAVLILPMLLKIFDVFRDMRRAKKDQEHADAVRWQKWRELSAKERLRRVTAEAKHRLDSNVSEPFADRKDRLLSGD